MIELDLMTTEQRSELPEDEEVTAADRLIVESPTDTGLIVMRALAPEPGLMPAARARSPARSASRASRARAAPSDAVAQFRSRDLKSTSSLAIWCVPR